MFSSFIKFILFSFILCLSFLTIIALFTKYIVLNETFYTYSFRQEGVYKNLTRGVKKAAAEFLITQVAQNSDYDKLTLGERQDIENQVENFTSFINEENVRDLLENNIKNIIRYTNSKSDELYLYFPLNKWGLPESSLNQIPESLKKTDVSYREILTRKKLDTPQNIQILYNLKNLSLYLNISLLSFITLQLLFILLYLFISGKNRRYQAVGKLFTLLGIIILIFSWILFTAHNIFLEGLTYKTGWSEILAGTIFPIFIKPMVLILTLYGLIMLVSGIVLYNREAKNKLVTKAKYM